MADQTEQVYELAATPMGDGTTTNLLSPVEVEEANYFLNDVTKGLDLITATPNVAAFAL